jgi:uncharacterized protein YegP (UPF0339 family)
MNKPISIVDWLEYYQGEDGQYYWRAKSGNGEIVAFGEGYTTKSDAKEAATGVFPEHPIKWVED